MRYPVYSEYRDSGVEWLGEVPEGWEVKRLKMSVHLNDKKVEADEENLIRYVGMENIESWTGKLLPIDPHIVPSGTANRFSRKNTLFGKLRPYLAKACNPGFDGLCSTELLVIESDDFDRRALLYWILADGFINLVDSSTYGSKMPRANWEFIGNCSFPVPPVPEQTAIADFLDRETGRIDTLVAKKRRLIALLKEKRTALISRTVTRGLPAEVAHEFGLEPNTRFKDSGIEWLGVVPGHWELKRLGFITLLKSGDSITSEQIAESGKYPVYGGNGLRGTYSSYTHEGPFILIGRQGALCGNINYTSGRFWASEHAIVVNSLIPFAVKWLGELLRTMNLNQYSLSAAQPGLSIEQIRTLKIPVPPIDEQTAIATYLDRETAKIDCLVEKVESAIARLREYRTALITAAVTGKIDVRDIKKRAGNEVAA